MSIHTANTATTNILNFPRVNEYSTTRDPAEISERILEMKICAIDDALSFIAPPLFEAIGSAGFTLDIRKSVLLVDVMRSIMFNHFNIEHPLDEFLDKYEDEINAIIEYETEKE